MERAGDHTTSFPRTGAARRPRLVKFRHTFFVSKFLCLMTGFIIDYLVCNKHWPVPNAGGVGSWPIQSRREQS